MSEKKLEDKIMDTVKREDNTPEMLKVEPMGGYTPSRFSVKGLRKHQYVRMNRTPRVVY